MDCHSRIRKKTYKHWDGIVNSKDQSGWVPLSKAFESAKYKKPGGEIEFYEVSYMDKMDHFLMHLTSNPKPQKFFFELIHKLNAEDSISRTFYNYEKASEEGFYNLTYINSYGLVQNRRVRKHYRLSINQLY